MKPRKMTNRSRSSETYREGNSLHALSRNHCSDHEGAFYEDASKPNCITHRHWGRSIKALKGQAIVMARRKASRTVIRHFIPNPTVPLSCRVVPPHLRPVRPPPLSSYSFDIGACNAYLLFMGLVQWKILASSYLSKPL